MRRLRWSTKRCHWSTGSFSSVSPLTSSMPPITASKCSASSGCSAWRLVIGNGSSGKSNTCVGWLIVDSIFLGVDVGDDLGPGRRRVHRLVEHLGELLARGLHEVEAEALEDQLAHRDPPPRLGEVDLFAVAFDHRAPERLLGDVAEHLFGHRGDVVVVGVGAHELDDRELGAVLAARCPRCGTPCPCRRRSPCRRRCSG